MVVIDSDRDLRAWADAWRVTVYGGQSTSLTSVRRLRAELEANGMTAADVAGAVRRSPVPYMYPEPAVMAACLASDITLPLPERTSSCLPLFVQ